MKKLTKIYLVILHLHNNWEKGFSSWECSCTCTKTNPKRLNMKEQQTKSSSPHTHLSRPLLACMDLYPCQQNHCLPLKYLFLFPSNLIDASCPLKNPKSISMFAKMFLTTLHLLAVPAATLSFHNCLLQHSKIRLEYREKHECQCEFI